MNSLPNPFTDSVAIPPAADSAVASSLPVSLGDATADPFNDEPLPLFMTDPAPELDGDIEAIVRTTFDLI